jgi:hypothetical protein
MEESTLFVVRVWQLCGFRASARRVDDDQTYFFESSADLAAHLASFAQARECADADGKDRRG